MEEGLELVCCSTSTIDGITVSTSGSAIKVSVKIFYKIYLVLSFFFVPIYILAKFMIL